MAKTPSIQEAQAALRRGELDVAERIAQVLARKSPEKVRALHVLALCALHRGKLDRAGDLARQRAKASGNDAEGLFLLGQVRAAQGRMPEAIEAFDGALRARPGLVPAIVSKAEVLEKTREHAAAIDLLEALRESSRLDADGALVFARLLVGKNAYDEAASLLDAHLARMDPQDINRSPLLLQLGYCYESLGRFDEAFDAYRSGNAFYAHLSESQPHAARVEAICRVFSREFLAGLPRAGKDATRAIFIVGMPRCGSTLVERILGAHPAAHAAGEIAEFGGLVRDIATMVGSDEPYPDCVRGLAGPKGRSVVDRLQQRYLRALQRLDRAAERVTDKLLGNYMHLGLIERIMPGASVIHCRRDPLDTCISCYARGLLPNVHPYAADLGALGRTYRAYEKMMAHWREVLEMPVLDVTYEDLIAAPEQTSREIVEFCGLTWDERCLTFHSTPAFSNTISYDQVTRPIYSSSVGRYRHFEKHLGPLREALACAK